MKNIKVFGSGCRNCEITANAIAHRGILDKGVHFIQKPFTIGQVARKVREMLDTGC